jgi:ectoine hydroxylase-related dioxygenase (phytanoyl-CoA dioxygenase family)
MIGSLGAASEVVYNTKSEFDKFGFAGPFPLHNKNLAMRLREEFPQISDKPYGRHRDVLAVKNIIMDKNLQGKMFELCSKQLLLWRTNFFVKTPGSEEIGWHHDKHFQSAEAYEIDFHEISSHFSICLALHDMDSLNGGLEVIPGSHIELPGYSRDKRPFYSRSIDDHFTDTIPEIYLRRRRPVNIKAGEFMIFHSALMHRSLPFESGHPRVSFVSRFIDKGVTIPESLKTKLTLVELYMDKHQ